MNTTVGASSFSRPAMAYVTLSGLRVEVPGMVRDWCMRDAHTYSIAKSLVSVMVWGWREMVVNSVD